MSVTIYEFELRPVILHDLVARIIRSGRVRVFVARKLTVSPASQIFGIVTPQSTMYSKVEIIYLSHYSYIIKSIKFHSMPIVTSYS